ncbi:MAG: hypothetical protein LBI72_14275 [Flavobacteriaceae bacterium]|jgi:hypothetical protein|nr:hypothetical protein [Flavobacteriaceae bacterium]
MKKIIMIAALLGMSYLGHAQVGIGTMTPHKDAILEIASKNKGVLLPKVELVALNNSAPLGSISGDQKAIGMLVFNTKVDAVAKLEVGFYMWTGVSWSKLSSTEDLEKIAKENLGNTANIVNEIVNNFFNDKIVGGKVTGGISSLLYDFEKNEFYTVSIDDKGKITKVKTDITKGIRAAESKTFLKKGTVVTDATMPATVDVLTLDATKLKKGQIFYEYHAEDDANGKPIVHYIDVTNDVYTTINNNEDIKKIINETVKTYLNKGGNVYFGDHDGNAATKDVLYFIDDKDNKKTIDIGETIKEFFTNSKEELIKEIREGLGYNITSEVVSTGNKLEGKVIYTFSGATTVNELDAQTTGIALPTKLQGKGVNVYSIKLFKPNGQVEQVGITDVEVTANKIDFALGNGMFYVTRPAGTYKVVVEFVEK